MAKTKRRPHPGALSDLLKRKNMTQLDAAQVTRVDRKTLAKIERGDDVKKETLEKVANGLRVPASFFDPPVKSDQTATKLNEQNDESARGLIMLRELDTDGLSALLQNTKKIDWHLTHLRLVDEKVCELLEQFGQAVDQLHQYLHPNYEWLDEDEYDPFSLGAQLNHLKRRRAVASLMDQLAEHRISVLGADFIQWHVNHSNFPKPSSHKHYQSTRILALSVEQAGTRSRPVQVFSGLEPPKFAPITDPPTKVFVDGVRLPGPDGDIPLGDVDDEIPF